MRLLYLVSHPIQYQAPLLRQIAAEADISLRVLFERMDSTGTYYDTGFGTEVTWDVPLTDGYENHQVDSLPAIEKHLLDADVVWLHGWDSMLKRRTLEMARRRGLPVLMRGENTLAAMPDGGALRGVLKRAYLRWIFYRCSGFLCIGSDNAEYYRRHGVSEERLFDMPYAIDNQAFGEAAVAADRDALRRDLDLEPERPVVLFAGKLQDRKNPKLLFEAMQRMDRAAGRNPYLLFVGDGEARSSLEKQAAGTDWVRVLGFQNQSQMPGFYSLADLFVLPSQREPWGLAVNEAMACGCAVIATDECGCAADLVTPDTGRVIRANNGPMLVAALANLLGDPARCRDAGAAAQKHIQTWSFREDIDGLKKALRSVVSGPRPT